MNKDHLQQAGKLSRQAHDNWLLAMRDTTPASTASEAKMTGNLEWAQSKEHLKLYGMYQDAPATLDEVAEDAIDNELIDFAPLERSYKRDLFVKIVNRCIVAALIFGLAYLLGYGDGRLDGPYPTDAQVRQQLQDMSNRLEATK